MQKIDLESGKFGPPAQCGGAKRKDFCCGPPGSRLPLVAQHIVKHDDFDPALPKTVHENIVLVEQSDRLKSRTVDARRQVEQGLVRAADGSVFVTLDDQNASGSLAVGCFPG